MSETAATTHEARDSMLGLINPASGVRLGAKVAVPAVQGKITDGVAALRQPALRAVT
jgi:hypothetical protein